MKKILSILLIFSFLFPQEICEGTCYTDEEVINIEAFIQGLENEKEYLIGINKNMSLACVTVIF